jgi:hypothetical protein
MKRSNKGSNPAQSRCITLPQNTNKRRASLQFIKGAYLSTEVHDRSHLSPERGPVVDGVMVHYINVVLRVCPYQVS